MCAFFRVFKTIFCCGVVEPAQTACQTEDKPRITSMRRLFPESPIKPPVKTCLVKPVVYSHVLIPPLLVVMGGL